MVVKLLSNDYQTSNIQSKFEWFYYCQKLREFNPPTLSLSKISSEFTKPPEIIQLHRLCGGIFCIH